MSISVRLKDFLNAPPESFPVHESAFLQPRQIVFSAEVRKACEANQCGRYGTCWTCPPGAGDWEKLRDHFLEYENAFVFTTCHPLEDSFDFEGMEEGARVHALADKTLMDAFEDCAEPHELAGAGSCSLCAKCTYPDAPCRHPSLARRSMEACGIDVVTLARDAGLHYMNGPNTTTYFSIFFF